MNTEKDFAELLKARGDVAISLLRQIYDILKDSMSLIDEIDSSLEVDKAPAHVDSAIANALRAKYPGFKKLSDAEILKHFDI